MDAEEISDEKWQRIADEAAVLEEQYRAAGTETAPSSAPGLPPSSAPALALPPAPSPAASPHPTPVIDADPYALALSERDAQIERLRSERAGELANYRNKIRALQNQLLAARSGAAAAGNSTLAPRIAQLETEKVRMARELAAAQREAVAVQERLAFAEHELQGARDRERTHLAALRGSGTTGKAKGEAKVDVREFGMLEAGALTQGGAAATQAGAVVEATQVLARRPASAQGFEMNRSSIRAPVRRRRRPTSASARLSGGGGDVGGPSARGDGAAEAEGGSGRATRSGRKRGAESVEDGNDGRREQPAASPAAPSLSSIHNQQHGWGVRLSEATWEHGALRARVFGGGVGDRLLEIATTLKEKPLRQAIMRAMARDSDWSALLEPVASLQDAGRAATVVSAECLAELLTFSQDCRYIVGRGESTVLKRTNASLTKATRDRDARVAGKCLQVLVGGACGIGEVGMEGSPVARREVRCDAALEWIRGAGEEEEEEDAAGVEARRGAVALVEAVTGLALEDEEGGSEESDENSENRWRAAEWMFVEKGYLCICDAITNGEADDYTLKHGCAMLVRAGVCAPYVVAECGGSEAAANALMHAVRRGDDHVARGVALACAQVLCMGIAGSEGDAGIAAPTRNVLLGVIAGVRGDGMVAKECKRVAVALAGMQRRKGG